MGLNQHGQDQGLDPQGQVMTKDLFITAFNDNIKDFCQFGFEQQVFQKLFLNLMKIH